jgi:hypothetical protein
MGLESYEARYTMQLTDWNMRVFNKRGLDVVCVPGSQLDTDSNGKIVTGQVLDAHSRSYFSMSQLLNLVQLMQQGQVTSDDVIYFEDMFSPGIESLPYILNQTPKHLQPKVYVRCLAQTVDPDDFVHVWGMSKWMSLYEHMVGEFATVLATNEEMVAMMKVAGWTAPIYNISGLAFGKEEVQERVGNKIQPFQDRKMRVVFAARWDQEKQPDFYMDLIEHYMQYGKHRETIEFAILQGGTLRSNDQRYVDRAKQMQSDNLLTIHENLKKNEYYAILNDSRVMFNCALQDWVSNTVSEADALGCNVLYPAYRSFPETFANDHERLYVPWSMEDAFNKLEVLLENPHKNQGKISDWTNGTIDRVVDIMLGDGEEWLRNGNQYRNHCATAKF